MRHREQMLAAAIGCGLLAAAVAFVLVRELLL